jgi:mannose-6-phosphate isomerase class I
MIQNKYLNNRHSNYDKEPFVDVIHSEDAGVSSWSNIITALKDRIKESQNSRNIIVVDYYPGVHEEELEQQLINELGAEASFKTMNFFKPEKQLLDLTYPDVTDDTVFGFMTRWRMVDFFDEEKLQNAKKAIETAQGVVLVYGYGASLLASGPDLLIYADMPRWEIQGRFRRNEISNLGVSNNEEAFSEQYKRGYFVDWRVADRHKKEFFDQWEYVLDTTKTHSPKMVSGDAFRRALQETVTRPFRVVPFFDPGPWGGQWMKEICDLDRNQINFAWCFDCVPEENSLLLKFRNIVFETPSINLVFFQSRKLLGEPVQARFGDEFPIRFDFLDTMEGGNLSLQVHPTTEYIREAFGMFYTQDESYYLLDAGEDACVYLGLKESINPKAMIEELKTARTESNFDTEKHVNKWPAKKHDHVLIPAGTVHCSGTNCMVLEISATPYIFTFKLWDWGRLGLDGKPRPINIDHGQKVIDWDRKRSWTQEQLINCVEKVAEGDGWLEEKTGLHEREFIETRRFWFTEMICLRTNKSVNVLNLVEGREAIVESPAGTFEPFIVHYAETFIVPAEVKEYTVRPHGESEGQKLGLIKAFVRY